jgi:gamma-glutamyltranspeptidase
MAWTQDRSTLWNAAEHAGNVDAAVATAAVLNVVQPMMV